MGKFRVSFPVNNFSASQILSSFNGVFASSENIHCLKCSSESESFLIHDTGDIHISQVVWLEKPGAAFLKNYYTSANAALDNMKYFFFLLQ